MKVDARCGVRKHDTTDDNIAFAAYGDLQLRSRVGDSGMDRTESVGVHRASGRFGFAVVPMVGSGILVGAALGTGYGLAQPWLGIVGTISVLLVIGWGAAIAFAVRQAGRAAHCRSTAVYVLSGLVAAGVSLYASWCGFAAAMTVDGTLGDQLAVMATFIAQPGELMRFAEGVAATGWYEVDGIRPSGLFWWGLVAAEAAVLVGAAAWWTREALDNAVYCEGCGEWRVHRPDVARFGLPREDDITALTPQTPEVVAAWPVTDAGTFAAEPFVRLDLWDCPGCTQLTATRFDLGTVVPDEGGNMKIEMQPLKPRWLVDRERLYAAVAAHQAAHAGAAVVADEGAVDAG